MAESRQTQNQKEGNLCIKVEKKIGWVKKGQNLKRQILLLTIHLEVDRAHQFLYIVNDTLQKCEGVGFLYDEKEEPEHLITLVFQAYDDVHFPIGYADKGCYLLDSKFIYKRYCHFRDNIYKDEIFDSRCGKSEYYSSLFRLGILKPYGESKEPVCKVRFDYYSKPDYKKCFCISSDLIDFDMRKMRVY